MEKEEEEGEERREKEEEEMKWGRARRSKNWRKCEKDL